MTTASGRLQQMYQVLLNHFGQQHWWPADSTFETMVGAVLTQNTNWQNVSKALTVLKNRGVLFFEALEALEVDELAECIRSSGYYNLKARRLKNLLQMIRARYDGSLAELLSRSTAEARAALLGVKGVGQETADSILLYCGDHPVFVVDAYTHRICSRHDLIPEECDYQTIQELFMDNLPRDAALFNEFHALLVATAKTYCKKKSPLCEECPLNGL